MSEKLHVACVQMNSGPNIEINLQEAEKYIREAAGHGSKLIATPEVTDQVISNRAEKIDQMLSENEHPGLPFFSGLARELKVYLLIGSMCIKVANDKMVNRSYLIGPAGNILGRYDKIHMYDVDLPTGESHRESKVFQAGDKAVLKPLSDEITLGMSICYDMRFPHLYRNMAKKGAHIFTVPSAFTVPTGQAHWESLLRARAIETGCFVMAPAQCGDHEGARKTYGHSLIVGPWGEILAEMKDGTGVIEAELDFEAVVKARQAIPSLQHDREFTFD
tara:strand:- start:155 stop:982 length:828 start_codon:yes stop_codon:yes gene_type:complete